MNLLSTNHKIEKSNKAGKGYVSKILHLLPSTLGGGRDLCPFSSPGCREACLNLSGRGVYRKVQETRGRRTELFLGNPDYFLKTLADALFGALLAADKRGGQLAIRPNGTSDIPWERLKLPLNTWREGLCTTPRGPDTLITMFPRIQFYDYTKNPLRMVEFTDGLNGWPPNYHLTFSAAEDNLGECLGTLEDGGNVAVVGRGEVPEDVWGYPTIDGDEDDLRFLDPRPSVVWLTPKGRAKRDESGFVVNQ